MKDLEILARLVELAKEREKLKLRLSSIDEEFKGLEEIALTIFEKAGIRNVNIQGRTVYVSHMISAKMATGDRPAATNWVKRFAPELVGETFNLNSLSAWLREIVLAEGGDLDKARARLEGFGDYFELRDWWRVKVRKT